MAQWLRNLIAAGYIALAYFDESKVEDFELSRNKKTRWNLAIPFELSLIQAHDFTKSSI